MKKIVLLVSFCLAQTTVIRAHDPMHTCNPCDQQLRFILSAMKEETKEKFEETYAKSIPYGVECSKQKVNAILLYGTAMLGSVGVVLVVLNHILRQSGK